MKSALRLLALCALFGCAASLSAAAAGPSGQDGKLPVYSMGGAVPFINLSAK